MHFVFDNVNDAFYHLVKRIEDGSIPTIRTKSRVGDVLQIQEPVIITYKNPRQRVLFNEARDGNPVFHLVESLWMLAGRNDVAPLKYYASQIGEIASDDGITFNGAYGYRWRKRLGIIDSWNDGIKGWQVQVEHTDQLKVLIDHLKKKPESRRAVLQMWNVEDDLLKIDVTKDVCCNLSVMFSIRQEEWSKAYPKMGITASHRSVLDMTVTNRSNDMIWGMLGANVVHFSFLHEYMACCLGVGVGVYNQISNNLHVYVENNGGFKPKEWLGWYDGSDVSEQHEEPNWYPKTLGPMLVQNQEVFDAECKSFVIRNHDGKPVEADEWEEPFLAGVAQPMVTAFNYHKSREYPDALDFCRCIEAEDWRIACTTWINKRRLMWEKKQNAD